MKRVAHTEFLHTILIIDSGYVLGISDTGTSKDIDKQGKVLDTDDLRLTIQLPAGHLFLLESGQHLQYKRNEKGYLQLHICEYEIGKD